MAGVTGESHDELDRFLASVERRALRMAEFATRDREEALDLVQDAMLQLVRRYRRRPPAEWGALFYRILENRIHDWRRSKRSRSRWWGLVRAEDDDAGEDQDPFSAVADAPAADPLHALQRGSAMDKLELALRELPHRQRQAFLLRVWEGLDVADTARAMGCSDGSVKTHLSRALASLRASLAEDWP
jgi:RNA polymerase sigma-70 factor (ECF subfamily)